MHDTAAACSLSLEYLIIEIRELVALSSHYLILRGASHNIPLLLLRAVCALIVQHLMMALIGFLRSLILLMLSLVLPSGSCGGELLLILCLRIVDTILI
jgi:hypothetical protein